MIASVDIADFWVRLLDNSMTLAAMAVAIWWLQRFVGKLDAERGVRLDAMAAEIERLRTRSDKCEEDRLLLHQELRTLTGRVKQTEK